MADPLAARRCVPCEGGVPPLTPEQCEELMRALDPAWQLDLTVHRISRRFTFVGFNRPMGFVNAVAFIAQTEGHHPEMTIGYGFAEVSYRTYAIDGLSDNDFICAAKIDRLIAD
ncbi:MAG: 4a-hydroxytetrahydrobiopterin dehydratase [Pseudomonadota bacterium]